MFSERRSSPGDSFLPFSNSDSSSPFEKLIADYFDSATIGLAIFDCDLRYVAINRTLAAVNGESVSDHRSKTVREILGDFADSVEPYFQQVLSTGEEVRFEVSGTLPATGETGHWASHYFPIKDQEGRVARIGAMVVDIAAQKKLEESVAHLGGKLRQKTGRLQMLSDVTAILSSNWDVSKVFPQISARIRRVL